MSKSTTNNTADKELKTCFIIMPISDHPDYPVGHFKRVYEHIIKPACESAGFKPTRADDVKETNYIALDIIKEIIESDMAICDLSSKNPNVLYEVGIRQAFNLPVTFIKDGKTNRIFDIQGFRDVPYDHTLRIDTVDEAVIDLSETLENTYKNKKGINSLITMLGIQPAKIATKEINFDTELILNEIRAIRQEIPTKPRPTTSIAFPKALALPDNVEQLTKSSIEKLIVGDLVWHRINGDSFVVKNSPDSGFLLLKNEKKQWQAPKNSNNIFRYLNT